MDQPIGLRAALSIGKALVALIFFMNALGIVDQAGAARDLVAYGVPANVVPVAMWSGRIVQFVGALLLLVRNDRLAAIGCLLLVGFLASATVVAHRFWSATGDAQVPQLINFLKNVAIIGGLLSLASIYGRHLPNTMAA
jgi:putative oxidoreductase